MKPVGLKEVEAAKADGRWGRAYDSPSAMQVPEDFLKELSKDKKVQAFFETLNKANTYAIVWRLQTAKKAGNANQAHTGNSCEVKKRREIPLTEKNKTL